MYKVIQNNLYLTRGDTAVFPLKVTYMDDTEYNFEEGDISIHAPAWGATAKT